MYLKGLNLKNFRNLSNLTLEFHPRFNIFVGSNAQGKTNILEAIYFLSYGRSFRLPDYRGLIFWDEKEAFIRSWVFQPFGEEERMSHLALEKKKHFRNGKASSPNQFQSMPVVLFAPEEISLLRESPQARRNYIDGLLSKLSPIYGGHLQNYKRALGQRNKLLKDEGMSVEEKRGQMALWESPLIEHGKILIRERQTWVEKLSGILENYYYVIGGDEKKAVFSYAPHVLPEDFSSLQESKREEEIKRGLSLVGPHRDDLLANLDEQPINEFGSQGEMRTFTLALKLAEIQLFQETLKASPILLLDDVLSELDEKRSEYFFKYLQKYQAQVFATATSITLFPSQGLREFWGWEIKKGKAISLKLSH